MGIKYAVKYVQPFFRITISEEGEFIRIILRFITDKRTHQRIRDMCTFLANLQSLSF